VDRTSKYLLILCILNVAAFSFHGIQFSQLDRKTQNLNESMQSLFETQLENLGDAIASQPGAATISDYETLRAIVREEMSESLELANFAKSSDANQYRSEIDRQAATSAASHQRAMVLQQDLNHYLGLGRMDKAEMISFQYRLAKLPKAEQQKIISQLTKAINAGEIEAQF